MNLLIVDNNLTPSYFGAPNLRRWLHGPGTDSARKSAATTSPITLHVRRGPDHDLPARLVKNFDGMVISGSRTSALETAPWIEQLHALIREAVAENIPTLGVCYGHQAIARALGGLTAVRKADRPEIGWTRIDIRTDNALFRGLPSTIYSFSSHFEEVAQVPRGAVLLGHSEACAVQAFQIESKPIFGIQFHPEKSIDDAEYIFKIYREMGRRSMLLGEKDSRKRYDASLPQTLFGNFLKLCAPTSS